MLRITDEEKEHLIRLGERLQVQRLQRKLTQEALAEILGLDRRTVLNAESGNGIMSYITFRRMVNELKIPADKVVHDILVKEDDYFNLILIECYNMSAAEQNYVWRLLRFLKDNKNP